MTQVLFTREHFERQNAFGRLAEDRVGTALFNAGWRIQWKPRGNRRDLEAEGPMGTERVEIKNEDRQERSDNFCVELYQGYDKHPSGLAITEATVCVHTFGEMCMAYRVREMRQHVDAKLKSRFYELKNFGKADNGNGGVLAHQVTVAMNPWAQWIKLSRLAESRVWRYDPSAN